MLLKRRSKNLKSKNGDNFFNCCLVPDGDWDDWDFCSNLAGCTPNVFRGFIVCDFYGVF